MYWYVCVGGGGEGGSVLFRTIFSRCLHVVTVWAVVYWIFLIHELLAEADSRFGLCECLDNVYLETGYRSMASLTACQTRSPAEDLQLSQDSSHHAHRAKKRKHYHGI